MKQIAPELKKMIGLKFTSAIESSLLKDYPGIRIRRPGSVFTMDFRPFRLNVDVDADNVITNFMWG